MLPGGGASEQVRSAVFLTTEAPGGRRGWGWGFGEQKAAWDYSRIGRYCTDEQELGWQESGGGAF